MSQTRSGVLAVFEHVDSTIEAIHALKKDKRKMTVITPVPNHDIADAIDTSPSPVRWCTLIGGIVGGVLGFTLCAWTSLDWPLITNGKEILSIPPFMVIMFECTILVGGLTNLVAMLYFSGLPDLSTNEGYDPRFTEDRFGIWVPCGKDDAEAIAGTLRAHGAEEVRVEAA
jgi:molybdopterin-containing oxidoreductase family membrane subunit